MDHNKQKLSGVFAPVVTPFQNDNPTSTPGFQPAASSTRPI